MTEKELREHLDFVDGVQKAQMLVLRLLLREQPSLKTILRQYADQLDVNPPAEDLTSIQLEAMKIHLLGLSK
jgi:hypothetical protein